MVRMLKWLSTAMVVALWVVACGETTLGVSAAASSGSGSSYGGPGGDNSSASASSSGAASSSSSSSSGLGGMGAGGQGSSSSSSGAPTCNPGGAPCQSFSDCCSGTCSANVCTPCGTTGQPCAPDGCCVGDVCYHNKCGACSIDGDPCQQSGECCSTVCSQGQCVPLACFPLSSCGSYCADLKTDQQNCGFCGHWCGAGETCCAGSCVNLQADDANCGNCGKQCAGTDDCSFGTCSLSLCCEDSVNVSEGELPPVAFSKYMAWPFTPQCDMLLAAIDIFTTQGWLYFMSDAQGAPGSVLMKTGVSVAPIPQWAHVPVQPHVQLTKGEVYWISHYSGGPSTRTVAASGLGVAYKVSDEPGPPNNPVGPWMDAGVLPIMFKVFGDCAP